jgi:membrane peptidoglycan carboxypeptidase
VDLATGLAESLNTVYFRLAVDVGPAKVAATAHAAGIGADVRLANPQTGVVEGGIALGQYEVHVTDQAAGYATFAAQGVEATPYVVAKVVRGGRTEYQAKPRTRQAFPADVSADTTYAMQQVITSGTGTRARLSGGRPAAGKTGTTDASNNVWFCGFTPQLAAAVWFGYGDPSRSVAGTNGRESSGGAVSAPVWKAFMDAALKGQPVQALPKRADVGRVSSSFGVAPTTAPPTRTPTPTQAPSSTPTPAPSTAPTTTPSTEPTSTPTPTRTRRPPVAPPTSAAVVTPAPS